MSFLTEEIVCIQERKCKCLAFHFPHLVPPPPPFMGKFPPSWGHVVVKLGEDVPAGSNPIGQKSFAHTERESKDDRKASQRERVTTFRVIKREKVKVQKSFALKREKTTTEKFSMRERERTKTTEMFRAREREREQTTDEFRAIEREREQTTEEFRAIERENVKTTYMFCTRKEKA